MEQRTAKHVIDEAISQNRSAEMILYTIAIIFVVVGSALVVYAAATELSPTLLVAGIVTFCYILNLSCVILGL